jgi:hypothetical protein
MNGIGSRRLIPLTLRLEQDRGSQVNIRFTSV